MKKVRVLLFGDLVGTVGCMLFQKYAAKLKQQYRADLVIVNGENAASNGRGITPKIAASLMHNGADIITGGNHIFQKKEIYPYLAEHKDILRPINFPNSCPGTGVTTVLKGDTIIGVINVQGRIFMREHVSCPFRSVESALTFLHDRTKVVIIDMHAEATSEKICLASYFDGKVSAVIGTHSHVQTADERILPGGTAFISDAGMSGSLNSMIGMKGEPVLYTMLNQMPARFEPETSAPFIVSGVFVEIDVATGHALSIERVQIIDEGKKD